MKRSGFTLVELLIVIIIIGILATMAVPQYNKMVEKAKWSEAVTILGALRQASIIYYAEHGVYPNPNAQSDTIINVPPDHPIPDWLKQTLTVEVPDRRSDGRYVYALYRADMLALGRNLLWYAYNDTNLNGTINSEPVISITIDGKLGSGDGAPNFQ